jgi:precorrin-4 methylase
METVCKKRLMAVLVLIIGAIGSLLPAYAENMGKLYVVGMGPAGPDLTAPRALGIIEQADFLLCSPRMPERFARFGASIDPSKIAFDPWEDIFDDSSAKKDPLAKAAKREKQRRKVHDFVLEKIAAGKTVVMMDGGDPCVYGPTLNHLLVGLDDRHYEVIPGMGAFNAAAAALKRSMTCADSRFVMLTSPESLLGKGSDPNDAILQDLSKYKTTMVFYMSLRNLGKLTDRMRAHFPLDLPVAVVYYAGYQNKERVLRSTLADIVTDIKPMDEKWLGLVVIGECIR